MEMEIVFPGGKKVDARYNGFTIKTDQAIKNGGEESAPQPFDLFLASIGTCIGINILTFCQFREISVEKMKLVQRMEKYPKERTIKKIYIDIMLPPDFPPKYRNALIRVANLCAVKKHMGNPPEFSILDKVVGE